MPPRGAKKAQPVVADDDGDMSMSKGPGGLDNYVLPKSVVTRIAKESVPENVKLQKEVPLAITKGSSIFINYLAAIAHDLVASRKQVTIQPDHVLAALDDLDWGQADTAALKKDLKKQLRAYRANAQAKKEGRPLPYPSTASARLKSSKTSAQVEPEPSTSAKVPKIKNAGEEGEIPSDPEDESMVLHFPEMPEGEDESPFNSDDDQPVPEDYEDDEEVEEEDEGPPIDPTEFEDEMGGRLGARTENKKDRMAED